MAQQTGSAGEFLFLPPPGETVWCHGLESKRGGGGLGSVGGGGGHGVDDKSN